MNRNCWKVIHYLLFIKTIPYNLMLENIYFMKKQQSNIQIKYSTKIVSGYMVLNLNHYFNIYTTSYGY